MLSHRVIFHGRRVCHARKPACGACTLAQDVPVVRRRPDRSARGGQAAQGPARRPNWPQRAGIIAMTVAAAGLLAVLAVPRAVLGRRRRAAPARAGSRCRSARPVTCLRHRYPGASPAPTAGTSAGACPMSRLACFDGVRWCGWTRFDRPTVINLWASLVRTVPHRAAGRRRRSPSDGRPGAVIGVDTGDTRTGAQSMVSDLGLTLPDAVRPGLAALPRGRPHRAAGHPVRARRAARSPTYTTAPTPLDQPAIADLVGALPRRAGRQMTHEHCRPGGSRC